MIVIAADLEKHCSEPSAVNSCPFCPTRYLKVHPHFMSNMWHVKYETRKYINSQVRQFHTDNINFCRYINKTSKFQNLKLLEQIYMYISLSHVLKFEESPDQYNMLYRKWNTIKHFNTIKLQYTHTLHHMCHFKFSNRHIKKGHRTR